MLLKGLEGKWPESQDGDIMELVHGRHAGDAIGGPLLLSTPCAVPLLPASIKRADWSRKTKFPIVESISYARANL
jgi:hypothetical protein